MQNESIAFAEGLSQLVAFLALFVVGGWLLFLGVEFARQREAPRRLVLVTGVVAALAALMAILRPVRVVTLGSEIGPRVAVLLDQSRRMRLSAEPGERRRVAADAVRELVRHWQGARLSLYGFADGKLEPLASSDPAALSRSLGEESDLKAAFAALGAEAGERPDAVVAVSDGRVTRPPAEADDAALTRLFGELGVPIHTVRVAERSPADASIRSVSTAGAAVAHQPLALRVTVGCAGGLACDKVPVTVRELRKGAPPALLADGVAEAGSGEAGIDLTITVERAGQRIIEVAIDAPGGDRIPENDARVIALDVARERVRVLHVAGRPTYDARQLRVWLKSNESVDLVAFFILRTTGDQPNTIDDRAELSLIPFPVEELFTEHLPSFDAIVLQDIDAVEYRLHQYLGPLAAYVLSGGGLIMVGGPSAFAGGRYQGSPIERVLPVELPRVGEPYDLRAVIPRLTEAGRAAPVMAQLIALTGGELPAMQGSNSIGRVRPSGVVLWEHPERSVDGAAMPLLALGETGDGRSISLAVDGTHLLAFSEFAEKTFGRAYGALWDGLLGWLMRDPRYELGRVSVAGACIEGEDTTLEVVRPIGSVGRLTLSLERLGERDPKSIELAVKDTGTSSKVNAGRLLAGGYSARLRVGEAPPTRFDFACERGGEAFRDSRPDPGRLERLSRATGGKSVAAADVTSLERPKATLVASERRASPLLPSYLWALVAALGLGLHWLARRRAGLA